jgi:hypothetical protein
MAGSGWRHGTYFFQKSTPDEYLDPRPNATFIHAMASSTIAENEKMRIDESFFLYL